MDTPDALASASIGMRVQAAKLDVIATNLANASTAGFRARNAAFSSFDDQLLCSVGTSDAQGQVRRTDVATDLALVGSGYFAVATPQGVRYTRDGRMQIDSEGFLADVHGYRVLGALGAVRLPQGAHVTEDGRIVKAGKAIDRLRIVAFDAPCNEAESELLAAPAGAVPKRAGARVKVGYLEDSGVDAIAEMTALIAAQRSYEANQKSAQRTDETLRRLVTDVPAIRS